MTVRPEDRDEGFSLVELLVVVVVIGVLSGLAVPLYLQQRDKGHESLAKADIRQLAAAQELRLHDVGSYGTGQQLVAAGDVQVSSRIDLRVVRFDPLTGYCLSARHEAAGVRWLYDSSAGGLQAAGTTDCPTPYGSVDDVRIVA